MHERPSIEPDIRVVANNRANHGIRQPQNAMPGVSRDNELIALQLREAADLLLAQGANRFRAGAYRKASDIVARLPRSVREIFDEQGREGLEALPGIGRGIASAVAEMLITGRWAQLQRLRGDTDPEKLFRTVPGIGPDLAREIHDTLHI